MNSTSNRRVVKEFACGECGGTGSVIEMTYTDYSCEHCNGRRFVTVREANSIYEYDVPCPMCFGIPSTSSYALKLCKTCGGTGIGIGKQRPIPDIS